MWHVTLSGADANRRLDKFLFQYLNNAPHSLVYKLLRKAAIKLNGKPAQGRELTAAGDCLTLYLSDETRQSLMTAREVPAAALPSVVFEDADTLILNKPMGLASQGGPGITTHLLAQALAYLHGSGAYDASAQARFTPALCNRLDVNTGGLVVAGKTLSALQAWNAAFAGRGLEKRYWAVAEGRLTGRRTLEGYYRKDERVNKAVITPGRQRETDKEAVTRYEAIGSGGGYTLLRVWPVTGRSHQIRAHLAAIGHPLAGDRKYGGQSTPYAPAQLLFCQRLTVKGEGLPYPAGTAWEAPLPARLSDCLREWEINLGRKL